MSHRALEIKQLHVHLEGLRNQTPQTVAREWDIAQMEARLRILEATRELEVATRAWELLEAYRKTGNMRVRVGDATHDASPVVTANPIQNVWNVKYKARDLAAWSIP